MKIIRTLRDSDFDIDIPAPEKYEERRAVRAIVFDTDKNVALLHSTKEDFYAVPGGGIEEGEYTIAALERELLEEIGCNISNIRELGIIEEYYNKLSLHQLSYCFVADVVGEKGAPHFEPDEIEEGFEPVWMPLEKAIKTLESETGVKYYRGKFIQTRDLIFLREASAFNPPFLPPRSV